MILVRIGGAVDLDFSAICQDIADLWSRNRGKILVVHGASKYRNNLAEKLKIKVKKIISASGVESYLSDAEFMDVFLMAYAGLVNKKLTAELISLGVNAVGLSGIDGKIWLAERKKFIYAKVGNKLKLIKNDLSGKIVNINQHLLKILLKKGYLPVLCSPAVSNNGQILNVDNDAAVSEMIEPFGVKVLISLFSSSGFLQDPDDEDSVIREIKAGDLDEFLSSAKGTMKKKIIFAKKAFERGLQEAYLGDGRIKNPIKSLLGRSSGTYISL